MKMRHRYRIEPTCSQQAMLARVFGCCRVVFNDALRVRDEAGRAGLKLSDSEIQRRVITQAKETVERGWLTEVPSVALVQSVNDSRRAWHNFFDSHTGKRCGHKVGRPRMKSKKNQRQAFQLTRNGFSVRLNGRLFVAKVGEVRVRWSRQLPSEPSSVTIIREPDGHYYASFVVDVPTTPLPVATREAGVDVGISRLATVATSDQVRTDIDNPKHLARKLRKLRRLEREKSRRTANRPCRSTRPVGRRWLGAASRAQSIAVQHARERTAFGKALGEHQGVSFMIPDNEIALQQCRLAIWWACWTLDKGDRGTGRHESSMVKAFVSEELFKVADRCVQILGGTGISDETPVGMIFSDMRAFRLYDGPTEVHNYAIARQVLRSV
jgi:Acyl-CoA dehydrogenase, C-terminal domain/Helix-turn-helix domain/Probable transposase